MNRLINLNDQNIDVTVKDEDGSEVIGASVTVSLFTPNGTAVSGLQNVTCSDQGLGVYRASIPDTFTTPVGVYLMKVHVDSSGVIANRTEEVRVTA